MGDFAVNAINKPYICVVYSMVFHVGLNLCDEIRDTVKRMSSRVDIACLYIFVLVDFQAVLTGNQL